MFTLILPDGREPEIFGQFDTLDLAQDYLRKEGYKENKASGVLPNTWDGYVRVCIAPIKTLEQMSHKLHQQKKGM